MQLHQQINRTKDLLSDNKPRAIRRAMQRELKKLVLKQLRKEIRQDKRA